MNNSARHFRSRRTQLGLTLIELMVAITVGLILTAGVLQIFLSNQQTYRIQETMSRLQENGRFAINMLTRDIRMAGFWGCNNNITNVTSNLNTPNNYVDPSLGNISGTTGVGGMSDAFTLQMAYGPGLPVKSHSQSAATFATTAGNNLKQFQIILVGDCTRGDISQITNANPGTSGTVVVNTGLGVPGNATKPPQYTSDAKIYAIHKISYQIANGADGRPSLFYTEDGANQEVVEDVDSMQILYGEDIDADGTANRYVPAGTAGLNMTDVVSVRIFLNLSTAQDNVSLVSTGGDRRIRETFTTTIVLRNRTK
jgi:type IV pilus assembly protein PilW